METKCCVLVVDDNELIRESLQDVLDAKLPVIVHAEDVRQITAAVALADEEELKLILAGGYDAPKCAALLKKHDIPVIVGGT